MVGHDDRRRAGLLGFEGALDGHDALDDKGLVQDAHDLPQLFHALAAGRRVAVFQEGQAGGVHVHGHGKAAALPGLLHLGPDGVDVPGLDGGHAQAAGRRNGAGGLGHDVGVGAVAGKGRDARLCAGPHQHVIVGHVGVGVRVVEVDRPHRPRKEGIAEAAPEQLAACVDLAAGAQNIHVQPDLGPLVIVADGGVPHPLGPRAGDAVAAGHAVADWARLAGIAQLLPGIVQYVCIGHIHPPWFHPGRHPPPFFSVPMIPPAARRVKMPGRRKIF